jgi:hypothetical protein
MENISNSPKKDIVLSHLSEQNSSAYEEDSLLGVVSGNGIYSTLREFYRP